MKPNCLIIGSGSWGTAIANVIAKNNIKTTIWSRNELIKNQINKSHKNKKYFPNLKLSKKLKCITGQFNTEDFDFIFYVIPASEFESFSNKYLKNQKINNFIICSKGLSSKGEYLTSLVKKQLSVKKLSILSGPSFADEVIRGLPTALSLSSNKNINQLGQLFINTNIRIYYSTNIETIEYLSVMKNLYAIGAGIIEGMSLGQNARAAYITRCIHEVKLALKIYKLNTDQIFSLAGIGDLILSCSSIKSRNFKFGYDFIYKKKLFNKKTTIEGMKSGQNIQKNKIFKYKQMPILNSIVKILNGSPVKKEIKILLERKFRFE
jgi:glycerol-3-phosphate dehydrogenase (NAD(P)+)